VFRRILVPVDFTPRSLRAVRAAAKVAATTHARTTLLHVIERIDDDRSEPFASFYRKLESSAREKLKGLLAPFAGKGLSVRAEILYGKPVGEILRFAQGDRTDLIVMSSHKLPLRRSGESWGTVSYKVGILSRCPVLLVK
jgi:nucleotide-binding universal stress UspA family protein